MIQITFFPNTDPFPKDASISGSGHSGYGPEFNHANPGGNNKPEMIEKYYREKKIQCRNHYYSLLNTFMRKVKDLDPDP